MGSLQLGLKSNASHNGCLINEPWAHDHLTMFLSHVQSNGFAGQTLDQATTMLVLATDLRKRLADADLKNIPDSEALRDAQTELPKAFAAALARDEDVQKLEQAVRSEYCESPGGRKESKDGPTALTETAANAIVAEMVAEIKREAKDEIT